MANGSAKRAPKGKYHKTGLAQLRKMVTDNRGETLLPAARSVLEQSFRDQLSIISVTHIPEWHEPWRVAVIQAADMLGLRDDDLVIEALANLRAGEREARGKRNKKNKGKRKKK